LSFDPNEVPVDQLVPPMSRYEPLGLIANPFRNTRDTNEPGVACETDAAGNRLLAAVYKASFQEAPKPIWVEKNGDIPSSYSLAAIAHAETSLATDDALDVLYAYVQLFMFKVGVTRGTLGVLAERLSFREVDSTLAAYVEKVLGEPDESLASYQILGPDQLAQFASDFREDPAAAVDRIFGEAQLEKHEELIGIVDLRRGDLEDDGDETDDSIEIDDTIGDAPGTSALLAQSAEEADPDSAIRDYVIDYTRVHLSPVIARGLRMYRERGLAALSEELKITKAPRKTLASLVELSKVRFRKVALIYDEFQSWSEIPNDLRSQVVASITNIRWKLSGSAVLVFMIAPGEALELEEMFGGGERLTWSFRNLETLQQNPDHIDLGVVNEWLMSAALPDSDPLTMDDKILAQLVGDAAGSFTRLIALAREAIESAADRGVALDTDAREAALAAVGVGDESGTTT